MLRNAWYAVAASDDLQGGPSKYVLLGQPLVLFRATDGNVSALGGACPHRGCDLSLGHVEDGQLICPYHGWRFNAMGACTHIPANRKNCAIPTRFRARSYPAVERFGLVWVYPGVNETQAQAGVPNLEPPFSELDSTSKFASVPFSAEWKAHFTRVVESVLDVSHLPFVHPESAGEDISPVVDGPEYHVSGHRLTIYPTPFAPAHPMEPVPEEWSEHPDGRRTIIELFFPNHWMIRTPVGDEDWMCTYLTFTPTDDSHTAIFGYALRNFEPDNTFLDTFHIEHTLYVMGQDQEIVEHLNPAITPFELHRECHVASDAPTIRFRAMLRERLRREQETAGV